MKLSNDNGINVTETVNSDDSCYKARIVLKNVFGKDETELKNTKVIKGQGFLSIINKKSGRGFLVDYD